MAMYYLRRRCDDDEETAPRKSNKDRSPQDKKLRRVLQKLQRKSGVPILASVIRDPFHDCNDDDEKDIDKDELDDEVEPRGASSSSSYDDATVWAAGTGYGCSFDNANWNMSEWDRSQMNLHRELTRIIDSISQTFVKLGDDENVRRQVRRSCLILLVHDKLSTSSMSEMNKHFVFFSSILTMLNTLADRRPELHSLCTMNIAMKDGSATINLWKTMTKLYDQAKQAAKLSSSFLNTATTATTDDDISTQICSTFENMKDKFSATGKLFEIEDEVDEQERLETVADNDSECKDEDDTNLNDDKSDAAATSSLSLSSSEAKEMEDQKSYVDCMEELRFDMVESFSHHKFLEELGDDAGFPGRKLIRRLGSEFSDLSVSLPLNEESSIFLRVCENRMDMVKFLVVPADGTPYAGGCFVFDAYFPPSYPDGPPRVNLMTTGGGCVRFNPNLYEDGYVCLSLLGTWSGQSEGEKWQPNISTFLQVVLSGMDEESRMYSEDKQLNTVKWAMIDALENPTPAFKSVILRHFYLSRKRCIRNATSWLGENHELVKKLKTLLDQLDESVFTDDPRVPKVPDE